MSEDQLTNSPVCFGAFTADLRTRELRKHGVRLRLPGQSFQILQMLLQRPGELATREELRKALWPSDTFVDFEHGLNAAVNRLREVLGDSAERPQLIETLPRRGYRFIGTITQPLSAPGVSSSSEVVMASAVAASQAAPGIGTNRSLNWLEFGAGIFASAAFALALIFMYLRSRPRVEALALTPVPFTSYPGIETAPTFSPDGSEIAFAWNGDPAGGLKGFDLYVKLIGSEKLLRLTKHPSEWLSPAWSPDGTQIAFHRGSNGDSGLYVVPVLGGPERKLRATHLPYDAFAPISWSADNKWIAFADVDAVSGNVRLDVLSATTFETTKFHHQPECSHDGLPAFSPEDSRLAYVCVYSYGSYGLYLSDINGGNANLVTKFAGWPDGITWEPGTKKKMILAQDRGNGGELFEVTLADGTLQKLPFGEDASWAQLSSKGDKLAYTRGSDNVNIWRKDLFHPDAPAVKLIASTREQNNPQYSPDGKHVAFESIRNGDREIWISDADGTNLVQVSNFGYPLTGTPHWSPDSQKIAFDSRVSGITEVYIADISELVARKLATNTIEASEPSWSHDGKWIYFLSGVADGQKLYRCPATGGPAIALSKSPATGPLETFDRKLVIFADKLSTPVLKVVSPDHPGEESALPGMPQVKDAYLWTVVAKGIYFVPADAPHSIRFFDFASKRISPVADVDKDLRSWIGGLSASPDGRWIIYSQVDESTSDIMLVEHFH